ncbi:mCG146321, partial [Mus musculus]
LPCCAQKTLCPYSHPVPLLLILFPSSMTSKPLERHVLGGSVLPLEPVHTTGFWWRTLWIWAQDPRNSFLCGEVSAAATSM